MVYTDGIHLVADTLDELHEFAQSIGLKRKWFQDGRHPHYDIWGKPLEWALKKDIHLVSSKEIVIISKKLINEAITNSSK